MISKKVIIFWFLIKTGFFSLAQTFQNPIISGFHPDPSICRVNDDYYLVNSSFAFFPGVPIFHSKDLIHWKQIGYCLTREEQLPLKNAGLSDGIWAPTIRYYKGKFYMVTTNMTGNGHFMVTAIKPEGPWSKPIWLGKNGIDPSLFFDDDGKCYFTSNGVSDDNESGIIQYQINPETGEKLSKTKLIHSGVYDRSVEGPHLYKIGRYYYLMMAEGGTHVGHMETIARSKQPFGPFENCPNNPILTHKNNLFETIQATGHGDLIEDHKGNWWIVFLGIRNKWGLPPKHSLGRETFLAPVTWENDWPVVNHKQVIKESMIADLLPPYPFNLNYVIDEFADENLSLDWNFIRNPDSSLYKISSKPGVLHLFCKAIHTDSLKNKYQANFIGRRQEHFYSKFSSEIKFVPKSENEKAGLVVIAGESFFIEFFISKEKGKTRLKIRRKVDDIDYEAFNQIIEDSESVTLEIKSTPWTYEFYYKTENQPLTFLYKAQSMLLTTEVAGGFVGNYYGLFASSSDIKSANWAKFLNAYYRPYSNDK